MNQACKTNIDISIGSFYCYGEGFVKVLMQDYGLLHGVIAFVTTHYNAWWRLPAVIDKHVLHLSWCNSKGILLRETSESSHTE